MADNSDKDSGEAIKEESLDISRLDDKSEREIDKIEIERASDKRDERLRSNMLDIGLVFLWTLSLILLTTILIFAWHKLTPNGKLPELTSKEKLYGCTF